MVYKLYSIILFVVMAVPQIGLAQEGFGGVRDNGFVRAQIDSGYVPYSGDFAIEGMLSEHHFPVKKERCATSFCVYTAMGRGMDHMTNTPSAYLFVEPISGLRPATFKRSPQNIGVVIDKSGSMQGWKFNAALDAVHTLVDKLGAGDRISIVVFDSEAELVLPSTRVKDKEALHAMVERLFAGGTTNIYEGMSIGFAEVKRHFFETGGNRLIVLTDERPNTGDTSRNGFLELTGRYAAEGIGLSILGVGLDLGVELAQSVSQLRGGSYHYLESQEQMAKLFGENFGAFLTPVAYDLAIRISPLEGFKIADIFGVPEDNLLRRADGTVTARASTVFYDTRRSGLIVRLELTDPNVLMPSIIHAHVTWSYHDVQLDKVSHGETQVSYQQKNASALAEFDSPNHYRGYALVNFAGMFKQALGLWHEQRQREAITLLEKAHNVLNLDAWINNDLELVKERTLATKVLTAMKRY